MWQINTWNERFDELKEFYAEYGHFSVPSGKYLFSGCYDFLRS
jgi:hypothetical protein